MLGEKISMEDFCIYALSGGEFSDTFVPLLPISLCLLVQTNLLCINAGNSLGTVYIYCRESNRSLIETH